MPELLQDLGQRAAYVAKTAGLDKRHRLRGREKNPVFFPVLFSHLRVLSVQKSAGGLYLRIENKPVRTCEKAYFVQDDHFLLIICFSGKCISPTFAMPRRGMASLASVGLDGKTVALGLLSVSQHTSRLAIQKRRRVEPRHARTTSGQGPAKQGARSGGRTREFPPGIPEW